MTTDIFAPYEIAKQLKEIGFKELCIAYYEPNITYTRMYNHYYAANYDKNNTITTPTWEQVFKWFREKGYLFVIGYDFSDKKYNYKIVVTKKHNEISRITSENYPTYEEARENLALELIEIYKNK